MAIFEVDAQGMRCPAPILAIAHALKNNPGEVSFLLLADDPATIVDISAWARMTGNHVEAMSTNSFKITRLAKI